MMVPIASGGLPGDGAGEGVRQRPDPVFVLCMGRSGSTLLRFLLDAHPELACPPETSMPALCGQLSVVWSLIEGAPLAVERGAAPSRVPDAAVAGIRRMLDEMTGSYLARRGKRVFCDKSLGSARFVDLLMQIYPGARFLCLYRHPMDVIQSGLDACPWGLTGYGFDEYIVGSPGNAVLALARYWLDNATLIQKVEQEQSQRCYRIRYEDLVQDPEETMREVFAFVGVQPAPGVVRTCFSGDRERFGPADHKIWATSKISRDSVGRGESVPAGLILPQIMAAINGLSDELGYLPVGPDWGTPGRPADPRVPDSIRGQSPMPVGPAPGAAFLEDSLRSRLQGADEWFAHQWESCATEKFLVVSRTVVGGRETQWLVDAASGKITVESRAADENEADDDRDDEVTWSILGTPQTWDAILSGQVNLHDALRHNDLRYCPVGVDSPVLSQTRMAMLTDLLGLSARARADDARQEAAASL